MRRRGLVLVAAVAGLVGAACGGGDDEDRLSRAEFVEQGNAICRDGTERIDEEAEEAFAGATDENPPSDDEIRAFAEETVLPDIERQVDEVDELRPPEDLEETVDDALAEARRVLDQARDDPAILADEEGNLFDRTNELLLEAGLDDCADG